MSARVDAMGRLERNAYEIWYHLAARVKAGTCDSCGRNRHEDGGPLMVARQPRSRKFECLACWDEGH